MEISHGNQGDQRKMKDAAREMGVRTDVPFRKLTPAEREIVFHGPPEKKHILYKAKNSNTAGELDFTYRNAVYTVENTLAKVVDHDAQLLANADWIIELGPKAGQAGDRIIARGAPADLEKNADSLIAPFLAERPELPLTASAELFKAGAIEMATGQIHTVKPLQVRLPKGKLAAVTGVSGSGKTTMFLESLLPAIEALNSGKPLPPHVHSLKAPGIRRAMLIDATPIGINVRSTVATHANAHIAAAGRMSLPDWRHLMSSAWAICVSERQLLRCPGAKHSG